MKKKINKLYQHACLQKVTNGANLTFSPRNKHLAHLLQVKVLCFLLVDVQYHQVV